jgi:hypothetical protein
MASELARRVLRARKKHKDQVKKFCTISGVSLVPPQFRTFACSLQNAPYRSFVLSSIKSAELFLNGEFGRQQELQRKIVVAVGREQQ